MRISSRAKRYGAGGVGLLIAIIAFVYTAVAGSGSDAPKKRAIERKVEPQHAVAAEIRVDVKGEVRVPSTVTLPVGARVEDAVRLAGGLTPMADVSSINLSQKLSDEDMIIIPAAPRYQPKIDGKNASTGDSSGIKKKKDSPQDALISEASVTGIVPQSGVSRQRMNVGHNADKKIDINSATEDELVSLPGIGESLARSIVNYRKKKGSFKKIEDIQNVNGIGKKKFEAIREQITAGR